MFALFWPLAACARKEASAPVAPAALRPVAATAAEDRATRPKASDSPRAENDAVEAQDVEADEPPPSPPPKRYARVLSVGDSFNGAFSLALARRFRDEGATVTRDTWVGVSVGTFAREPRFSRLLAASDPDLVVVSLGANDVDTEDLERAAKDVRSIVARIVTGKPRDCWWVAPALWKRDKGIVEVLERSVAPCRFFASRGFKVERARDGWHPSVRGGADWAARFWEAFEGR